jgi:GT2 family glycosyltransferase
MSDAPSLSILIVAWNVRDRVLACLAAIAADDTAPDHEVILVDNASSDDTVARVRELHPAVRLIANAQNVGFPRANNQALAAARGRYVLYLNPDTEVAPGTLAACLDELERNADIGIVGCRLESADGAVQYDGARRTYRFRHLLYELLYLHTLFPRSRIFADQVMGDWDHRDRRDVEAVCGAFMMTPRQLALELGGLPEDVFMYHEDLSFCLRVLRTGRRVRYLGDVATVHHCGQSSRRSAARFGVLEAESKYRYVQEADGAAWAAAARGAIALRSVIRLGICAAALPVSRGRKARYPRVFDWRTHMLQLVWSVSRRRALELAPGGEKWAPPVRGSVVERTT